jgi:NAD(P)-dependent dehydrogenase (short-subunit alcohol dehydrogenase family)
MKLTHDELKARQRLPVPPVISGDLSGKTVCVVGANTGIGFEAAKHFAKMGPTKLILGCRNSKKGTEAVKGKSRTSRETSLTIVFAAVQQIGACKNVELMLADLMSPTSITQFAEDFKRKHGRLDVLVLNAGINSTVFERSPEGFETKYVLVVPIGVMAQI